MEQPADHPTAGGLLHHLLTLAPTPPVLLAKPGAVLVWGGHSLLPYPAVANCFYFQKWGALCCPDFPPVSPCRKASGKPEQCFQAAKLLILF